MKTQENNQKAMNAKIDVTMILLLIASIIWMAAFFIYVLVFDIEMLYSVFGTIIFTSTTVLVLGLLSVLICWYKESSEIIATKDAEFQDLLDKYLTLLRIIQCANVDNELSMTLNDEELRVILSLQDKIAELHLSDSQKKTMSELIKILSECENLES